MWRKHKEHLKWDGEIDEEPDKNSLKNTLELQMKHLHRHLCWYVGHYAYSFIKINKEVETPLGTDKKKEENERQALKSVIQSNLLSGGIDTKFLNIFSNETKQMLHVYANLMEDKEFSAALH